MGEMKRLLEERIEQILEYYFPEGMYGMSSEEKVKWYATAHRVADQLDEGIGYKEVIMEKRKK